MNLKKILNLIFMAAYLGCHFCAYSNFKNNALPRIASFSFHLTMDNLVQFRGSLDTLGKIESVIAGKKKGAYLRFEYEDINLLSGKNKLSGELRDAISLNDYNIIKSLPLYPESVGVFENGHLPVDNKNLFKRCSQNLKIVAILWGTKVKVVYSPFALHYSAVNYTKESLKFLRFLKKNNCCMFVGPKDMSKNLVEILFGKNCVFLGIDNIANYESIDAIERECLSKLQNIKNDGNYKIIVTSIGKLGTVLQKRLWKKLDNVFLFDCDSLISLLCGNNKNNLIDNRDFDVNTFISYLSGDLKILCTAALLDTNFEGRKQEYIKSMKMISGFGYEPYIVENCKLGPSFLNDYSHNVFYSNANNPKLKNKGVNEAKSLSAAFKHFNFNENDIILKLTGRYFLEDNSFIKLIEDNPEIDVFFKPYANLSGDFWAFSGCFAMRAKYFNDMLNKFDLVRMERDMVAFEEMLLEYLGQLAESGANIMYVDRLNIASHVYYGTYNPANLTHW